MQHPSRLKDVALLLSQEPFKVSQSQRGNKTDFQSLQTTYASIKKLKTYLSKPFFFLSIVLEQVQQEQTYNFDHLPPIRTQISDVNPDLRLSSLLFTCGTLAP